MAETMRTVHATKDVESPPAERARVSRAFEWTALGLAAWFVGGAYLDAWAHTNIPNLETFFTPWHAALYTGWLVNATFLGWW